MASILDFYIDPSTITIFSKTTCPFCIKAKQLIQSNYNIDAQIIELDRITDGPNIGQVLNHITHQQTVPNIFILGKHIGGYTELKQLHDDGELKSLLQYKSKYVCEFCGLESATKNLSCNCFPKQFGDWGEPL
jgi:glutaredoxin 3